MVVKIKANAKINLYLQVTGKRESGYHDLVTVMQSISLCDILTFERTWEQGVFLHADIAMPTDSTNLVCRAAEAYFRYSGEPFGIAVKLEKHIPLAAGMGGGSSDAAATLKALNRLDHDRFTIEELCSIGATVGADVPFCLMGGTQLCRGIGEVMRPVENNIKGKLIIAIGDERVSTPAAFAELDRLYDNFKNGGKSKAPTALMSAMKAGDLCACAPHFENIFEQAIEPTCPAVATWKQLLLANGAKAAMMSGSGPAVWGLFEDAATAARAKNALDEEGVQTFLCDFC